MEKIIDFHVAKQRILARRKQESRKRFTFTSVTVGLYILILVFSFVSTYQIVTSGNLSFLNMKIGMGAF